VKREFGIVSAIVECRDCGWTAQNYKNAQACAAKHAEHHKHKVSVEVTMSGHYDGKR
jgi:hypothetical protein